MIHNPFTISSELKAWSNFLALLILIPYILGGIACIVLTFVLSFWFIFLGVILIIVGLLSCKVATSPMYALGVILDKLDKCIPESERTA